MSPQTSTPAFASRKTRHPRHVALLRRLDLVLQVAAFVALIVRHGLHFGPSDRHPELALVSFCAMAMATISLGLRYRWSLARRTFLQDYRLLLGVHGLWCVGLVVLVIFAPLWARADGTQLTRGLAVLTLSEGLVLLRVIAMAILVTRRATAVRTNPAIIMVTSFALLAATGTGLLMLPRATADGHGAPFMAALFTATSASCVTGLAVENSCTYWSRTGQVIILGLFQIGGLGILTCGAFFAAFSARGLQLKESATLRELLESDGQDARRMLRVILAFTLVTELVGALLISPLWADEPLGERAFQSVFHSVSAFCNAGFSLLPDGFHGMGQRWFVWGPLAFQIILGAMGFGVMHNVCVVVRERLRRRKPGFQHGLRRVQLNLTTKLALITTAALLVWGAVGYFLLESTAANADTLPMSVRISDAWFQSVTFRTAGFNTTDHGSMQPATKLFAILLMFVGASPGSTGGGVKTVCFALALMAVWSILRGRERIEIAGRTVPTTQVNRALTVIAVGMMVIATTTLLLVLFERQEARFLDHLFEATSAFATVGVSTGITAELTTPSQLVIVATMFLGRVGPLTLLIALAGQPTLATYDYPQQRVTLG
ncbi:MAG: potassium-transporting ATPase subunit KdpA [Planctomycetota bacterium]|nr:potassium-transporting ATPase subunit KdpA [Planctomycetota bacterium]